jgi:hypothetical protein
MIRTKKKTSKVKSKVVKSKKKKASKKKVSKKSVKKAVKKAVKKSSKKVKKATKKVKKLATKKKKRKKRKKILMEDIYSIINKVQFGKRKVVFVTSLIDAPTIENNIKDSELKYDKVEMKTQVVFTMYPNDKKYDEEINDIHFEIMDDEIPDIGQIFG